MSQISRSQAAANIAGVLLLGAAILSAMHFNFQFSKWGWSIVISGAVIGIALVLFALRLPPFTDRQVERLFPHAIATLELAKSVGRGMGRLFSHWTYTFFFAPLTAIYLAFLEFGQNEWWIISNFKVFHTWAFVVVLCINVLAIVLSGLKARSANRGDGGQLLSELLTQVNTIVGAKLETLHEELAKTTTAAEAREVFKTGFRPDDQFKVIARCALQFLRTIYSFDNRHLNITILCQKGDPKWERIFSQRQDDPRPQDLFKPNYIGKQAVEGGAQIFTRSKAQAVKDGIYQFSDRDKRFGSEGSIYAYPVQVKIAGQTHKYLVLIETFKRCICSEYPLLERDAAERYLAEFCRRIELELHIKSFKEVTS